MTKAHSFYATITAIDDQNVTLYINENGCYRVIPKSQIWFPLGTPLNDKLVGKRVFVGCFETEFGLVVVKAKKIEELELCSLIERRRQRHD